jgi:hypothetical protein
LIHRLDVKWRWWWTWELDEVFPQTVETEEEFDLLGAFDGTGEFHGVFEDLEIALGGGEDTRLEDARHKTERASRGSWASTLIECRYKLDYGAGEFLS